MRRWRAADGGMCSISEKKRCSAIPSGAPIAAAIAGTALNSVATTEIAEAHAATTRYSLLESRVLMVNSLIS